MKDRKRADQLLTKGEAVTVRIASLAPGGDGVARHLGVPIFVSRVAPGDLVEIELFDVRKDFARGRLSRLLEPSPQRAQAPCKLFKVCGGCQLQHLSYQWQLKAKEDMVRQTIKHIGLLDPELVKPCQAADEALFYRNKVQFPVKHPQGSPRILAGYYKHQTHELVNVKHCPVQPEPLDRMLEATKRVCEKHRLRAYDEKERTGLLRHICGRMSFDRHQIVVTLVVNARAGRLVAEAGYRVLGDGGGCGDDADGDPLALGNVRVNAGKTGRSIKGEMAPEKVRLMLARLKAVAEDLRAELKEVTGVCVNFNPAAGNRILGDTTICLAGEPYLTERLTTSRPELPERLREGLEFRLSPTSFFQVHTTQAERLLERLSILILERPVNVLVDAFAGVGTMSLWLAPLCARVIAVEEHRAAVEDGQFNARLNRLDNVEFKLGRVEDVLPELGAAGVLPDVVLFDPPRQGVAKQALDSAVKMGPERILYVSCNPATLARDLKILDGSGYKTRAIYPIDMFPQTYHVESVALIERAQL